MNLKNLIKKVYKKLNPAFACAIRIENKLNKKFDYIQWKIEQIEKNFYDKNEIRLEREMLLTESKLFRYLYLYKYININDKLLDLDGEYGAGDNLLINVTPVSKIICLNTIEQFTLLGKAYYPSELLEYRTGTIDCFHERVQGIIAVNSKQSEFLTENSYKQIYDLLDLGGFFAFAVPLKSSEHQNEKIMILKSLGFKVEEVIYQPNNLGYFQKEYIKNCIQFIIAIK